MEEVLCVGSRWKGHIDRDGRKVMYSLRVTREESGGKKSGGLGNLVGMHTLLTSNNVVTINPLPDIPGLVRIAEKARGGIECIVRHTLPGCFARAMRAYVRFVLLTRER